MAGRSPSAPGTKITNKVQECPDGNTTRFTPSPGQFPIWKDDVVVSARSRKRQVGKQVDRIGDVYVIGDDESGARRCGTKGYVAVVLATRGQSMVGPPLPENSMVACVLSDAVIVAVAERSPTALGVKVTKKFDRLLWLSVSARRRKGPGMDNRHLLDRARCRRNRWRRDLKPRCQSRG